jgi:hypothetical protein
LIIGPRRVALIGAIVAVVLTIIFYPLLVETPFNPDDVTIQLSNVTLTSGNQSEQKLDLRIVLNVTNASDYTLTTSKIEYELFADGASVGTDIISYEDIPPNGRPAFFPNQSVTISDAFTFEYSDKRADLFNKILNNSEDISWKILGSATIESGTSQKEKQFSSEL